MRGEIMDWCTGIGIIEAVEHLYKTALENGNLSIKNEMQQLLITFCVYKKWRIRAPKLSANAEL